MLIQVNLLFNSWSTFYPRVDQPWSQKLINSYSICCFFKKSYSTVTQQVEFWGEKLKKVTQQLINMLILSRRGINKLINCWVTSWLLDPKLLNCWSTLATWVDQLWSPKLVNSWSTSWILEGKVTQQLFNMLILKNSTCW